MEGGLAACRIAKRFCNPKKNPRKDFSWAGGLATCRSEKRFCNKNVVLFLDFYAVGVVEAVGVDCEVAVERLVLALP